MIIKLIPLLGVFYIYYLIHRSIINLKVLQILILYPNLNSLANVKKLQIATSTSILCSFLFTPIISNIVFRNIIVKEGPIAINTIKNNLNQNKNTIITEILLEIFTAATTYSFLLIFLNYSKDKLLLNLIFLSFILILGNLYIANVVKKREYKYTISNSISSNRYISFWFISTLRIIRIIFRDIILISLLSLLLNTTDYILNYNLPQITFQSLVFNSSNYIQLLPANLFVPEFLCNKFNCLSIDYIWIRFSLLISTTLALISFKNRDKPLFPN